jgi:hypothetical protein
MLQGRQVENAAIEWVMGLETSVGRQPVDTRGDRAAAGDIKSPPRVIEVKAFGGSARDDGFLWRIELAGHSALALSGQFP